MTLFRLKARRFVSVFLAQFSRWIIGITGFHFLAFFSDYSGILPPGFPIIIFFLYLFFPVFSLIFSLQAAFTSLRNFHIYLENEYKLDFRLLNYYAFKKDNPGELSEILEKTRGSSLFDFKSVFAGAFLLITLILHLLFPQAALQYISMLGRAVNREKPPVLGIELPGCITENSSLTFSGSRNYDLVVCRYKFSGKSGEIKIKHTESAVIENITDQLAIEFHGRKGSLRITEKHIIPVRFYPELDSFSINITDPVSKKTARLEGAAYAEALPGSKIKLLMRTRAGTVLDRVLLTPSLHSAAVSGAEASAEFFISQPEHITPVLINEYGMSNRRALTIFFQVKKNEPPLVRFIRPASDLEVRSKQNILLEYAAEDDIALSLINLHYRVYGQNGVVIDSGILKLAAESEKYFSAVHDFSMDEILFLPGNRMELVLEAADFYGLKSRSLARNIHYMQLSRIYEREQERGPENISALQELKESAAEMEKNIKALGKSDGAKDARQKLSGLARSLEDMKEKISGIEGSLAEASRLAESIFSPEIKERIDRLRSVIGSLDRDFVERLKKELKGMEQMPAPDRRAVEKMLAGLNPEDFKKSLDAAIAAIEKLKEQEVSNALASAAKAVRRRHEDLKSFYAAGMPDDDFNLNKKNIAESLSDLNRLFQNSTNIRLPDAEAEAARERVSGMMNSGMDKNYTQAGKNREENMKSLNRASDDLQKLEDDLELLERRYKSLDLEKVTGEINYQIAGFSSESEYITAIASGRIIDYNNIDTEVLLERLAHFISMNTSFTRRSREKLFDLVSGYIPGIARFFSQYDRLLDYNRQITAVINPSETRFFNRQNISLQLDLQGRMQFNLARQLLLLKKELLDSAASSMSGDMQQAASGQMSLSMRMRSLLQKGSLTPAEQEYLQQMLAEQAMIRGMVEGMGAMGRKELAERGLDPQASDSVRKLDEIASEIKKLEEMLSAADPAGSRIREQQQKVEERFLEFNKAFKSRPDKQDEERKAEHDGKKYHSPQKSLREEDQNTIEQLENLLKKRSWPPAYEERINEYLDSLKKI